MPISPDFEARLTAILENITNYYGTPFHIYDEIGIRQTVKHLKSVLSNFSFTEYYAVKALPNPHVLTILRQEGCGFDCSSIPELILARQVGASGHDIMFTSNNTSPTEFDFALADGGCILNLDDISLLDKVPHLPEHLSFRLNIGSDTGNAIIGKPEAAKFGIPKEKIVDAYQAAQDRGVQRFGLHTMTVSNERDVETHLASVEVLCQVACELKQILGIQMEFINIGGGLGIPYHPDDSPLNLQGLADGIKALWQKYELHDVKLFMEAGRYITGSHGVLVTRAINRKESYRTYIGVDANMSSLMRPAMYGAYHHIEIFGKSVSTATELVDVVGALCENNDKFAIQRELPVIENGDLLMIHDTGAHGHAMGFNYNGRLRPQELLLCADGSVELIRRAEIVEDYFATLNFDTKKWQAH